MSDTIEGYLSTAQVQEEYGISRAALYRRRERGLLRAYKFLYNRATYWKVSEIEALSRQTGQAAPRKQREIISEG